MLETHRRIRRHTLALLVSLAAALTPAAHAAAQTMVRGDFAVDAYEPTPVGDRFFAVSTAAVDGHAALRMGLTLDYARDPLVLRDACTSKVGSSELTCNEAEDAIGSVVRDELAAHVGFSFALWQRALLSVSLPVVLINAGDSPSIGGAPGSAMASADGGSLGDLRLGLRVHLFGQPRSPVELGLGGYLWIPTGVPAHYTGDDGLRLMPHANLSGKVRRYVYGAQAGVTIRDSTRFATDTVGTQVDYGFAAAILMAREKLQLGPELYGSTVISGTTNLQLLAGAKLRAGNVALGAALGPGLTHGIGTPALRGLATIAFAPRTPFDSDGDGLSDDEDACPDVKGVRNADAAKSGCAPDRDGEGILDVQDACPDEVGVASPDPKKNGCPADHDDDGVADAADACPDVAGVPSEDRKKNGCPPDHDGDAIVDAEDACPDEVGVGNPDPKKNGCPSDRDGDTVPDAKDACPDTPGLVGDDPADNGCPGDTDGDGLRDHKDACPKEKGPEDPDPEKSGCPRFVRVTSAAIRILQQVQFTAGSKQLLRASDALLTEVAAVMTEHPEIKKVRIEGYSDDKGSARVNKKLSADRARSVMKWLTAHGVDAGRLEAVGFGKERPIADNSTKEGRKANRRVEFKIVDPAPPEDGSSSGPTQRESAPPAPKGADPPLPAKRP